MQREFLPFALHQNHLLARWLCHADTVTRHSPPHYFAILYYRSTGLLCNSNCVHVPFICIAASRLQGQCKAYFSKFDFALDTTINQMECADQSNYVDMTIKASSVPSSHSLACANLNRSSDTLLRVWSDQYLGNYSVPPSVKRVVQPIALPPKGSTKPLVPRCKPPITPIRRSSLLSSSKVNVCDDYENMGYARSRNVRKVVEEFNKSCSSNTPVSHTLNRANTRHQFTNSDYEPIGMSTFSE